MPVNQNERLKTQAYVIIPVKNKIRTESKRKQKQKRIEILLIWNIKENLTANIS